MWGKFLFILFLMGLLYPTDAIRAAESYKDSNFHISIYQRMKKNIVVIKGEMRAPMNEMMEKSIRSLPYNNVVEIRLDSVGGSIMVANDMVDTIKRLKHDGYVIHTRVDHGAMCASSCVPVYVQGEERHATSVSGFMFHGVAIYAITNVPDSKSTQYMINAYVGAGIDKEWINVHKEMGVWSTPNETWYNGKELFDTKSGFVTNMVSNRILIKSYDRSYSKKPR